jgi:predicted ABC-type ATPase
MNDTIQSIVDDLISRQLETIEYYSVDGSDFTEERENLHQEIIENILSRKAYSTQRRVYMLGGAPANGKSTFLNSSFATHPDTALQIDPDEIKKLLPEYQEMLNRGEPLAAFLVHEESSLIAKTIKKVALENGYDLILDGIANDTFEKREADYKELKSYDYTVRIDYVTLDTELSLKIAKIRAEETGREVPQEFVKERNIAISLLIPQLIENELFEELYLWDTNEPGNPRLILSQINRILHIENQELYENFKKKSDAKD